MPLPSDLDLVFCIAESLFAPLENENARIIEFLFCILVCLLLSVAFELDQELAFVVLIFTGLAEDRLVSSSEM